MINLESASIATIRSVITRIHQAIAYILAPPVCAHCKKFFDKVDVFCEFCAQTIQPVVSYQLSITQTKSIPIHALGAYQDPLKALILDKLHGKIISSYHLGLLICSMPTIKENEFDIIVPVPLHWTRFAYRGFNQAQEIAQVISKKTDKPVIELITRSTKAAFQSALSPADRVANVAHAFELAKDAHRYAGLRLLLVDDLFTTGTTLKEISKQLLRMEPASITGVVACRVV